jgi:cellobiose phosphorylase
MLAGWAVYCIEQFYTCIQYMQDHDKLAEYRARIDRLKRVVNEVGWDGDWYQRAMHDDGWMLGTRSNTYGKIWSNPNSFAIVSGIADEQRRARIFTSFEKYLDHELGGYTFYPPFAEPQPRCGVISRFAPGTKENGSIFGHSSRWRFWAECHGGRGDQAYQLLHKMLPTTRHEADADRYRVEPYAACQFIYGPETDRPGEGSHSWATGTACWTLLNIWEHLLGVRPEVAGLRIDPCLPSHWTRARMTRDFRGATYRIEIHKPTGICKGSVQVELDGQPLAENLIPPQGDANVHEVKVVISRKTIGAFTEER